MTVSFDLSDPAAEGAPLSGKRVKALVYRAPGQDREELVATETDSGRYEVSFEPESTGVYYVYPAVEELGAGLCQTAFHNHYFESRGGLIHASKVNIHQTSFGGRSTGSNRGRDGRWPRPAAYDGPILIMLHIWTIWRRRRIVESSRRTCD